MFKKTRTGISTIEVIIVLAISVGLFAVAIGVYANRTSLSRDNAARDVMSTIALLRNEAQQGYSPSNPGPGSELFGVAIKIADADDKIKVLYLKQDPDGFISSYSNKEIVMPEGLSWWLDSPSSGSSCPSTSPPAASSPFYSCYDNRSLQGPPVLRNSTNKEIILVFRNGTGEGYIFSASPTSLDLGPAINTKNYAPTYSRQGTLRLAFWVPNTNAKYYADFNLAIPNNQTLRFK